MHPNCRHVSLRFSFSLAFICRNIILAILTFHKLVSSARSYMKKASRNFCVSAFGSLGELAALPGNAGPGDPGGSGMAFEVGCTTSFDEGSDVTMIPPMDSLSCLYQYCKWNRQGFARIKFMLCFGSSRGRHRGTRDVSNEAERKKLKTKSPVITHRLFPLSRSESTSFDHGNRERSQALLEHVFDGM